MAHESFAPFLQFLRSRRRAADSDAVLLGRYRADRDEEAFAELVHRHGRLVWGVCRHVLGHHHDADDAFQATFFLLARDAGSVRTAIGGWLHATAWRVANRARVRAAARQGREGTAQPRPVPDPAAEAAFRELQALLHREIADLPAKYRTPFVLCVLEGKGRTVVAAELGWKPGTVASRLAWARRRLRSRLLRRGIDLAAALSAVEISRDAAAAMPPALTTSVVAAAQAGVVPAAVAALAHGGGVTSKIAAPTALVLVLGMIAAGTADLMGSDPPAPPPKANPAPRAAAVLKPTPTCTLTITGTATGPDGQLLAGASVLLMLENGSLSTPIARATTDRKGRYEFAAKIPIDDDLAANRSLRTQVSGTAQGFAFTWHEVKVIPIRLAERKTDSPTETRYLADPQTMDLTFGRPVPLTGRVLNEVGEPVVGAEIKLRTCATASIPPGVKDPNFWTIFGGALAKSATTVKTDRDGHFRLAGLPPSLLGNLEIRHLDFPVIGLFFANAEPSAEAVRRFASSPGPGQENPVWTDKELELVLPRPRIIHVQVINSVTGKPIPDIAASFLEKGKLQFYSSAETDADGKVTLRVPPGPAYFTVGQSWARQQVPGQRYVWQEEDVVIGDSAEQPRRVRLVPVCVLDIIAVDADTGKPVVGQPLATDPQCRLSSVTGLTKLTNTDDNGHLRLAIEPGRRRPYFILYDTVKGPTGPVDMPAGGQVKFRFELRRNNEPPQSALPPPLPPRPPG